MRLVADWWWWAGCETGYRLVVVGWMCGLCSKTMFDLTPSMKVHRAHLFSLNYASLDDAVSPMCQIHRASTLMHSDQEAMVGGCLGTQQIRRHTHACTQIRELVKRNGAWSPNGWVMVTC